MERLTTFDGGKLMTYHEITKKMKDLTMTPSDWLWLDNYLKETGSSHVYGNFVGAYQ